MEARMVMLFISEPNVQEVAGKALPPSSCSAGLLSGVVMAVDFRLSVPLFAAREPLIDLTQQLADHPWPTFGMFGV